MNSTKLEKIVKKEEMGRELDKN